MSAFADPTTRKWVIGTVAALAVSFAAGRYSLRQTVEKDYASKYAEFTAKTETEYQQRLKEQSEFIRRELEASMTKSQVTDKKTTTKPDGTTVVEEHTKTKETQKQKEVSSDEKKTKETASDAKTKQEQTAKESQVKEATKVIPPPSWRVYAAAALTTPTGKPTASYGAGAMYDLGPINVGGFGLYGSQTKDTTLGVTLGISF